MSITTSTAFTGWPWSNEPTITTATSGVIYVRQTNIVDRDVAALASTTRLEAEALVRAARAWRWVCALWRSLQVLLSIERPAPPRALEQPRSPLRTWRCPWMLRRVPTLHCMRST